jgi:hypothetical protein
MKPPTRYRLSDAEKDALLTEQAALIERMAARARRPKPIPPIFSVYSFVEGGDRFDGNPSYFHAI